jgi:membrane-associated phospholipid phosphatase
VSLSKLTPAIAATAALCALLPAPRALGQTRSEITPPSAAAGERRGIGSDLKAYVTAPVRWNGKDWLKFGGTLGAITIAYQRDGDVRDHFAPISDSGATTDTQDLQDALPAAIALGGTWLYATIIDDNDGRREAATMFEAAAFSSATAFLLKEATGRLRPNVSTDPADWSSGGDSFPSMHVTAAFAIGTVLAESGNDRYRWLRRVLGYGLAVGTAYERLDHNAHWLSDTVAGAGLGMATARFVMNRREHPQRRADMQILPLDGGLLVSYAVPLR